MVSARGGRLGVDIPGGAASAGDADNPGGADKPGGARKLPMGWDVVERILEDEESVDSGLAGKVDGGSGSGITASGAGVIDGSGEPDASGVDVASRTLGFDSTGASTRLGSIIAGVEGRELEVETNLRSAKALD